jgi:MtrB/PioB family decaheme-associated outer membrane protein
MQTRNCDFSEKVLARAVQLALLAMFAAAPGMASAQSADAKADEAAEDLGEGDVKSLVCPENFFELGLLDASRKEPKYGEYNGLNKSGLYGLGNFKVSGGNSYCQLGGNTRWQVYGADLGTTSRSLGGTASAQGQWMLGFNFDQLRHYTTTGFQTPYQGSQGSNMFTLPSNFGVINTGVDGGTRTLTPAQLAAFNGKDVYSERQNYSLNASYALNTDWNVKFNYKRIERSGAKLISGPTDPNNMTSLGGFSFGGSGLALRLNPTKDSTDMVTLAANWVGEKAYASFEYYGSFYHDDYRGFSFSNPNVTGTPATGDPSPLGLPLSTMSTPPSNAFNQINFAGGYLFSQKTKLTGGLSLGVNTQNSSYDGTYTTGTAPGLPKDSLHGRVINTHADARLTHQFSSALGLNTGFKYDERNNRTGVDQYSFIHIGGGNPVTATNAPESYRRTVFDAALNYRLDKNQRLSLTYKYDHMQRWCSNDMANNAQGSTTSYYSVASCMQVPRNTDNSLTANYKLSVTDTIRFDAGYTYADRDASINPSFYNPMQSAGGYENYGWLAYFQAPRREHTLKTRVDWQATEKLDVGFTGRFTYSNYYDSSLGVQNGHVGSLNVDAAYQVSENASYGAYATWQRNSRTLLSASDRNLTAPPANLWSNKLTDTDFAIGMNGKQKLFHDKFELTEDLSYNFGRSSYVTGLVQNIAPATGNSGQIPDIRNKIIQFRLVGGYNLNKTSRINVGYMFQRILSNDYMYNAYADGYTPSSMMPSGLQSPSYKIHVFFVTYRHTF